MKIWIIRFGWLVVTGTFALVGTEGFTRALMPQNRDTVLDILVPDPTVGYIYEAHASTFERGRDYDVPFVTNSIGLRDREYAEMEGLYRVLLIGNSFCVSHGVDIEGSLSRALERELQAIFDAADSALRVQVINASNAGYNTWNYWKSYERWAPVFQPDAVVVGFVPSREHLSDHEDVRFVIRDGLLVKRYREGEPPSVPRRSPVTTLRKSLARNSDLYVLLRNFFFYNERVQRVLGGDGGLGNDSHLVAPYRLPEPERVAAGRGRAFDYLGRLAREAGRDSTPLVILSIPRKAEILDSAWARAEVRAGEMGANVDRELPARLLLEHGEALGISVIDAGPAMRPLGDEGFFVHDNHWNKAGIAASAALLAEHWESLILEGMAAP